MAERRSGVRVNEDLILPEDELRLQAVRSGGPGGQRVNKVSSKVLLRFSVVRSRSLGEPARRRILEVLGGRLTASGEIVIQASRHRERRRNEHDAREKLARLLRQALEVKRPRRKTRPTGAAIERRLSSKRHRSRIKRGRGVAEQE